MALSGLQIFKYLPAAKKAENSNCKKCGCPTCMVYAMKLAKGQAELNACPYIPNELRSDLEYSSKQPQKTVEINGLKIGGETVLYRHEKTFINKTALAVVIDQNKSDWKDILNRVENFEIRRIDETLRVDLIVFKGSEKPETSINSISYDEFVNLNFKIIEDNNFENVSKELIETRTIAVKDKDKEYSNPVAVHFKKCENRDEICAKGAFYICKYANMLLFDEFDEGIFSTLMILRQNIFTDPQNPSKLNPKYMNLIIRMKIL